MRFRILFFAFLILLFIGCGMLGGFDRRTFPSSKRDLAKSIDKLYRKYPEYVIPDKWKKYDDWKERGFGFLDTRIFYFKDAPEEMYYVSFYGDSVEQHSLYKISIAIRAVCSGTAYWKLEKEYKRKERERIEQRFDKEIISKLEQDMEVQAYREK